MHIAPDANIGRAHRASQAAGLWNGIGRIAGIDLAKDQNGAGAWVNAARKQRGQFGDDLAKGIDDIGGKMWPGGMPTRALDIELHDVSGGGNRPSANTNSPHAQLGLGVDGKNRMHAFQRAPFNNVGRPTDPYFLGRLEDDSNTQRQGVDALKIRQCASQAEGHGGVYIVAASMHLAGHLRGIFQAGDLGDWQGINIRAES